jgi:hypothetical protein
VDSKALRNSLIPITIQTLDTLISVLLKHAREDCISILNSFTQKITLLDQRPLELNAFVSFLVVRNYLLCIVNV